jgi:hypothetical protein
MNESEINNSEERFIPQYFSERGKSKESQQNEIE